MSDETEEEKKARLAEKARAEMTAAMGPGRVGLGRLKEKGGKESDSPVERAVRVDPRTLKPLPGNDRIPPLARPRYNALFTSIREKGILVPLVCDSGSRVVVCGNNRLSIALDLGLESVPVIWKTIPDAEQLAVAIKDNVERRQLSEREIALIIAPYMAKLPQRIEEAKRSRTEVATAARKGESAAPVPSAFEETAKEILRETGVSITERAVKRRNVKTGGVLTSKPREKKGILKKPTFDDSSLKMTLHFPNRATYEGAKKDFLRHYAGWAKAKKNTGT